MRGYGFESSRRPSKSDPSTLDEYFGRNEQEIRRESKGGMRLIAYAGVPYVLLVGAILGYAGYAVFKGWL
jgi:hypothetical protein